MVLLIGNYPLDRQHSMLRFGNMMLDGLTSAGVKADLIQPAAVFGRFQLAGGFVAKWLAYVDKFVLFPWRIRDTLRSSRPGVVHICDHSNAMYAEHVEGVPVVVTCHDLLAVRGALGEETDTPASRAGRLLQRWILRGLKKANAIACVSHATCRDVERLVTNGRATPKLRVITSGLNYPYRKRPASETEERLRSVAGLQLDQPFVLHVGSNLRRKNREAVLRIFARCKQQWPGQLVFAGERLSPELRAQATALAIGDRIVELASPTGELIEALYNRATAFLFPSRFEGFGWPIAEAQACGCPVLCSSSEPMAEVAGDGAILHPADDEEAFARELVRLLDPAERRKWSTRGLENAQRFSAARMVSEYRELYRSLGAQC